MVRFQAFVLLHGWLLPWLVNCDLIGKYSFESEFLSLCELCFPLPCLGLRGRRFMQLSCEVGGISKRNSC